MTGSETASVPLYLGLGSDLGDREVNLREAVRRLDEAFGIRHEALSGFVETEPWGFESDTKFLNAVVKYRISLPLPEDSSCRRPSSENGRAVTDLARRILRICKNTERVMGREEHVETDECGRRIYRSRIIDIDILLLGDFRVNEEDLVIPHPLMFERDFVMRPLMQIVPPEETAVCRMAESHDTMMRVGTAV